MSKEKSYSDLIKEIKKNEKLLDAKENECAEKGFDFDKMIEETTDIRETIYNLSQEARLKQEPVLEFDKKWKGETLELETFKKMCEENEITNLDGFGYYATERAKSNILIYPSDILDDKYRKDFTHVIWFEKNDDDE